ncbi:uncharacterized protein LOC132747626 [Ruditapes philippinarum]|uniref:uncharacterized protein LOC132747626 n=1 Tax=Ruditapes philippinarum TaxID=129788 RepID=UPI00295B50D7|nr:uncharacterized protein LOC132747626 [Ruditapes philippinarum]
MFYLKIIMRNTFLVIISFSSVNCQSLDLPAERFLCGPLNLTCYRWGYTACFNPDGEYYCLPCDQEYVSKLCGTKDQLQGCNLYCTAKSLDEERAKMRHLCSEEKEDMQNNFTAILTEERAEENLPQNQSQQHERDMKLCTKKTRLLEIEIAKRNYLSLKWSLLLVLIVSFGCAIVWFCWRVKGNKNRVDLDSMEKQTLIQINNCVSEGSKILDETNSAFVERWTQTDASEDHIIEDQRTQVESNTCSGSGCLGKDLLQNVPPTNDRNGRDKMAIQSQDIDVPVGD